MLKKDLEAKVEKLEQEKEALLGRLKQKDEKVDRGLRKVIDETCSDSWEYIHMFCNESGYPFPKQKVVIETNYGVEVGGMTDQDYDDVDDFEVLEVITDNE